MKGELELAKRKSVDTPARKRRRLPHVAVIERSDPFLPADTDALYEQCRRITNGREFHHGRRWQHDRDVHVIHFVEAHQAKALEEWVRHNRFYDRPKPHYGPSQAERSAFEQEAVKWGIRTTALRRVVQAYRCRSREGGSLLQCHTAAQQTLRLYLLPPEHDQYDVAQVLVSWAMREHFHWFFGWREPTVAVTEGADDYPPPSAYPHSEE